MVQSAGASKRVSVGGENGSSSCTDRSGITTTEPAFDTDELLECLRIVDHQGNFRIQLVHAGLQGLDLTDLLDDFLAETFNSQLLLEICF